MPRSPDPDPAPAENIVAAARAADTTPATIEQSPADPAAAPVVKTDDTIGGKAGSYVVAPGRTVQHDDQTFAAGAHVKLDATSAKRLLEAGFILDKDGAMIVRADGPAVNVEDGVQVAQPA